MPMIHSKFLRIGQIRPEVDQQVNVDCGTYISNNLDKVDI